jgi:magnesium-transporting ATPase (P-type)
MVLSEDNVYISNPYIHYRTGKASLSVVYFKDNTYYVFDVDLISLLEELKLIEFNRTHDKIKRAIYFLGSSTLTLVSISLILYGLYIFGTNIFVTQELDLLHDSFKSIIAVTLGLAIFDLAKQIFEHEVLFQSLDHNEDKQYKVLGRFLISIIIALSIETLLVVFKIALSDNPDNMLSAFFLITGTTFMFIGLAWFYKTIIRSSCEFKD